MLLAMDTMLTMLGMLDKHMASRELTTDHMVPLSMLTQGTKWRHFTLILEIK